MKTLDDMARRIAQALPGNPQVLMQDLERNVRAALQQALVKMDLVTRQEFEVQQAVLVRSREKLEALEKQVAALEAQLLARADKE